jgi:hypothetical protein
MTNLLEAVAELGKRYAKTIDQATYVYLSETCKTLREQGENPADYELVMVSNRHVDAPLTTQWVLRIRKVGEAKLVD